MNDYRFHVSADGPDPANQFTYPYAVTLQIGDDRPRTAHFKTVIAADICAELFEMEGNTVVLWVALAEPEYRANAVVRGWRQVTYFRP